MKCPSCIASMINGMACHETGCPDRKLILIGPDAGQYLHVCRTCGCDVLSDDRDKYFCDCNDPVATEDEPDETT